MEKEFLEKMIENFNIAAISSGRNKEPDDFTVLHEYLTRYGNKPSILRITQPEHEYFKFDKLLKTIKKEFKNHEIIYKDQYYSHEFDKVVNSRVIIKLEEKYICELVIQITDDIMDDINYTASGLEATDELATEIKILVPSESDEIIVKKIVGVFKKSSINCANKRIIIEMIAMDRGELYTENFYFDDSFVDMQYPDLHYGKGFEEFNKKLLEKLRNDTKGLVLLHGETGTGKCVVGETKIKIRNKVTGKIKEINIEDLI